MDMKTIFIVEDDKEINRLICDYLTSQGYRCLSAENGLDAIKVVRENDDISLVLLDLMLPYRSGDMVLKSIREFSDVAVIIVSAKSTVTSKVDVIRLGADDYITKPFDLDELLVRVEAVLRRCGTRAEAKENKVMSFKNLLLDKESGIVTVNGESLVLTSKEFAIISLMLETPTKLFSKVNLFESVWEQPYINDDNTIKVHMSNIRSKIRKYDEENEYIDTIWSMGYKLHI